MERLVRVSVSIPMGVASEVIARALNVEAGSIPSSRVRVRLKASGGVLGLDFESRDVTAMRACVNSFLRWIDAALRVYWLASGKA